MMVLNGVVPDSDTSTAMLYILLQSHCICIASQFHTVHWFLS